jgi:mRNA interferase RelE/StbE
MAYRIVYHHLIPDTDLPAIPLNVRERIAQAVQSRLTTAPERYGSPLRGTLRGYWKLRVGDYRVVYRIVEEEVWILAIRHRRLVYEEARRRA